MQKYLSDKPSGTMALLRVTVFSVLSIMWCISCVTMKPLYRSTVTFSCETGDEQSAAITAIDKNIRRYHAVISPTVYLKSNYGSTTKTLKTYTYRNNNRMERILLFHIADRFNFELTLDSLTISGGDIRIRKEIFDDASIIIGNTQDLIFYVQLSEQEYMSVKNSAAILFELGDMTLELEPGCRNTALF